MSSVSVTLNPPSPSLTRGNRLVAVSTLGCKVNLYESNLLVQKLNVDQWKTVTAKEKADLYIINTCTVTNEADRQARQEVRRLIRKNPEALIVVTGCYAQMEPQACADIPGVDLVVGNDKKLDIHQLLPLYEQGKLPKVIVGELDHQVSLPDGLLTGIEGHTRAFMQIQQGCDQGCTFCIIHRARGPSRSIEMGILKRQAERLVMNGYRELVICGVDLGSYGEDLDSTQFCLVDLIYQLHDTYPQLRIRLSSIDPAHLSDSLIECFRLGLVCPHLHLSLQSANTLILKRMKRRYTRERVYQRIQALRLAVPDLVISADVMTGFPTEEEQHFNQTLKAIGELGIAYPHVFPYSARKGTPAAKIPRQVDVQTRKDRAIEIRNAGKKVLDQVLHHSVGREYTVLTENSIEKPSGLRRSRTENYLPVLLPQSYPPNQLIKLVPERVDMQSLIAISTLKTLN